MRAHRQAGLTLLTMAVAMLALIGSAGRASQADGTHPVVGRWNLASDVGGAVWTFQPSGKLTVIGPGDIVSEGSWTPAGDEGAFDATVDVPVTGQQLTVLGQVSADGEAVALYVAASEASRPGDWTPWPAESRLQGERTVMVPDPSPMSSPVPIDCLRPQWLDGTVDWDRCDGSVIASAQPSGSNQPDIPEATDAP
jgi:hypothetical protein